MNRTALLKALSRIGVDYRHEDNEWLMCGCPLAPWAPEHKSGYDKNPSFGVHIADEDVSRYHCLAGETRVITKGGVRSIASLSGETHKILTTGGKWVDAPFKQYGVQKLWKITLSRNGMPKVLYATCKHRWFVKGPGGNDLGEITTDRLQPKQRLLSVLPETRKSWVVDRKGFLHGIVFGDGTSSKTHYGRLELYGASRKLSTYLMRDDLVSSSVIYEKDDRPARTTLFGKFGHFKKLPGLLHTDEYLLGFLSGYLAADGCVSKCGNVTIASANKHNLEAVRQIATKLGISTFNIKHQRRVGLGANDSDLFSLSFVRSTLRDDFFVFAEHKRRFNVTKKYERLGWQVVSSEETICEEPVYCAEVPSTHAFALEDNILTGNCFTCKGKGTIGGLAMKLGRLTDDKDLFAYGKKLDVDDILGAGNNYEWSEDNVISKTQDRVTHFPDYFKFCERYPSVIASPTALRYLRRREISLNTSYALGLRYDNEQQRILFPVFDYYTGRFAGCSGRATREEAQPKVRDYAGLQKDRVLLGRHNNGIRQRGRKIRHNTQSSSTTCASSEFLIICEGLFAFARLQQLGYGNYTKALLGSECLPAKLAIIKDIGLPTFWFTDNDNAGQTCIHGRDKIETNKFGREKITKVGGALRSLYKHLPQFVPTWPDGKTDPDELTKDEVQHMLDTAELYTPG